MSARAHPYSTHLPTVMQQKINNQVRESWAPSPWVQLLLLQKPKLCTVEVVSESASWCPCSAWSCTIPRHSLHTGTVLRRRRQFYNSASAPLTFDQQNRDSTLCQSL